MSHCLYTSLGGAATKRGQAVLQASAIFIQGSHDGRTERFLELPVALLLPTEPAP